MTATPHARPLAHGIAVIGDLDLPAHQAHAHLRQTLHKRHPAGMASYVLWRRNAPAELADKRRWAGRLALDVRELGLA
jgi:hypothetical protein